MAEIGYVSELKPMRSAAGWYAGTTYIHTDGELKGLEEPNSRDSHYMATKEEAQKYVDFIMGKD